METGSHTINSFNLSLFENLYEELGASLMNTIILIILIISTNYVKKTVLTPRGGAFIKGKSKFLAWAKALADRSDDQLL